MGAKFNILAPSDDWYLNKILESDKTLNAKGVKLKENFLVLMTNMNIVKKERLLNGNMMIHIQRL